MELILGLIGLWDLSFLVFLLPDIITLLPTPNIFNYVVIEKRELQ